MEWISPTGTIFVHTASAHVLLDFARALTDGHKRSWVPLFSSRAFGFAHLDSTDPALAHLDSTDPAHAHWGSTDQHTDTWIPQTGICTTGFHRPAHAQLDSTDPAHAQLDSTDRHMHFSLTSLLILGFHSPARAFLDSTDPAHALFID